MSRLERVINDLVSKATGQEPAPPCPYDVIYTRKGGQDRLTVFITQESNNTLGEHVAGVQIEIPGSDRGGSFFQLALAPKGDIGVLEAELRASGFATHAWPISYAPASRKDLPGLLLPFTSGSEAKPGVPQRGKPVLEMLKNKGFVTEGTFAALTAARKSFAASEPLSFNDKKQTALKKKLVSIFKEQLNGQDPCAITILSEDQTDSPPIAAETTHTTPLQRHLTRSDSPSRGKSAGGPADRTAQR